MARFSPNRKPGHYLREITGTGSQFMATAKLWMRRRKTLVDTLPLSMARRRCSGRVSRRGKAAETVQALVLGDNQPAHLGDAVLELHQFVHDILPASLADLRIADEQVSAGDLEVDDRLLMRLVAGVEEAFGDRAVLGLEGFLAPGVVVLAPEDLPPAEHAVFRFHDSCRRV